MNKLALIYDFTNMSYLHVPSHSPTHLPDIFGFGWVSDATHSAPKQELAGNHEVGADEITASQFPVQLPRSAP